MVKLLAVFLLWLFLAAIVYWRTESNFLRAESGWYLCLSHSPPDLQQRFMKLWATSSYNGHYTPVAFISEFVTARFVGTRAPFWKWRQITVVALLATILSGLTSDFGRLLGLSPPKRVLSAAALTALFVFQPGMTDFIAWPFLIFQLLWLLLTFVALASLMKTVERPDSASWPWLAIGAAYGSLNFVGLGLTTVGATAAVLAGLLSWEYRTARSKKLVMPLVTLLIVSALHAFLMLILPRVEGTLQIDRSPHFLSAAFGFVSNFAVAALRTLISAYPSTLQATELQADWPYGVALIVILVMAASAIAFQALRSQQSTPAQRGSFVLAAFGTVCFIALVILISTREITHPSPNGFGNYLIGQRYLVPGGFALLGLAVLLFVRANAVPFAVCAVVNLVLVLSAITGNAQFRRNVYPNVEPKSVISHDRAWQSIVTMASQCQKAGLPIPNLPLGALTQEFGDWDLKLFEPLLRADLNVAAETSLEFIPWQQISGEPAERYAKDIPALREAKENLKLR